LAAPNEQRFSNNVPPVVPIFVFRRPAQLIQNPSQLIEQRIADRPSGRQVRVLVFQNEVTRHGTHSLFRQIFCICLGEVIVAKRCGSPTGLVRFRGMEYDEDKVDEMALALLCVLARAVIGSSARNREQCPAEARKKNRWRATCTMGKMESGSAKHVSDR
jgi:hypothetical protein